MNIEAIVYLLRKTSLTLKDIGELTPSKFIGIVNELYLQESIEEYKFQYSIASLLAAIYNTIPRKSTKVYKAGDFLKSEMPTRTKKQNILEELASKRNIRLPDKELKNRGE